MTVTRVLIAALLLLATASLASAGTLGCDEPQEARFTPAPVPGSSIFEAAVEETSTKSFGCLGCIAAFIWCERECADGDDACEIQCHKEYKTCIKVFNCLAAN